MGAVKNSPRKEVSILHSQSKSSFLISNNAAGKLSSYCPASPALRFLRGLCLCYRDSLSAFSRSLVFKELVAGSGNHGNKSHKFLEVTFSISIVVQCFHDFVHNLLLFDFL